MVSSPTSSLKLAKQATGDNLNTHGVVLNEQVIDLIDEAVAQQVTISLTGNHTLTSTNYVTNEARHGYIKFTDGGLASTPTVTAPSIEKYWWIKNSGSTYAITFGVSGGTSVSIPAGKTVAVFSDGTDCELVDLSNFGGELALSSIADIASSRVIGNMSGSTASPSLITVYDEDTMSSNSATGLATQQSIKAYVDTSIGSGDVAVVAANIADVQAVAAIDSDVSTVAADGADIGTVAVNIAAVNNVSNNMADVQNASSLVSGLSAGDVANVAAGNIAATDVQAALNELDGDKVAGPASATDSAVAQFDGTTGKLLKNGLSVGTSANNLVQLDGSARLPAVDGSQLTGISSVMDLINETTVSSPVASVAWTGLDTSTYETFMVQVIGASHNDAGSQYFYMQFSPDSGSTWRTSGYQGQTMVYQGPATSAITQAVLLSYYQDTSASFLNAELTVHNLGSSSIRTLAMGQSISEYVTVGAIRGASIGAGYDTAESHDSIRIIPQAGSLDAGTYRIFGVK